MTSVSILKKKTLDVRFITLGYEKNSNTSLLRQKLKKKEFSKLICTKGALKARLTRQSYNGIS